MNIYSKIIICSSLLFALVGCNKENEITGSGENEIDITNKYIHFDAGVATRASLVEGTVLQQNFNVLGYEYRGTWESNISMAWPSVFNSTPQLVTYSSGLYTYSPIKSWSGNTYSFMAYTPSNENITLFDGEGVKEGKPYITYNLPLGNDPTKMVDLMTAAVYELNADNSPSVVLDMHHRLSAIDITARNFIDEYDHDNNPSTDDKFVYVDISQLKLTLLDVANTSAKIYLDSNEPSEYNVADNPEAPTQLSYIYVKNSESNRGEWVLNNFTVTNNNDVDNFPDKTATQLISYNDASLLLIPQTEYLHATLEITYSKKYKDGAQWITIENSTTSSTNAITFSRSLVEGRRYFIEITFTSDAITTDVLAAEEWDMVRNVIHEFE